jgi:hypothetical protein
MSLLVPSRLSAGLNNSWKVSLADKLPSDGWALALILKSPGVAPLSLDADVFDADENYFMFSLDLAADTVAGEAAWQLIATLDGTRYPISSGRVMILTDLSAANAEFDHRTHAEKMLAAINALLEDRLSDKSDEVEFIPQFGSGRKLKFCSRSELLRLKTSYTDLVQTEREAEYIANGGKVYNYEVARFTNA